MLYTYVLDCMLYLTQSLYDPGISPSSANWCILGNVYLRSNQSRRHTFLDRVKQSKAKQRGGGGLPGPSQVGPVCPWCWSKPPSGHCHASGCPTAPWAGLQAAGLAVMQSQEALNTLQSSATVPTGLRIGWQGSRACARDSKDSLDARCQK